MATLARPFHALAPTDVRPVVLLAMSLLAAKAALVLPPLLLLLLLPCQPHRWAAMLLCEWSSAGLVKPAAAKSPRTTSRAPPTPSLAAPHLPPHNLGRFGTACDAPLLGFAAMVPTCLPGLRRLGHRSGLKSKTFAHKLVRTPFHACARVDSGNRGGDSCGRGDDNNRRGRGSSSRGRGANFFRRGWELGGWRQDHLFRD